ncbi:methyl-accepting chemotaxis protein [Burkholderiaceae bacterium DAT-1]|nr:methyl-accepting chemotaxis protein [Burkholderiaceae bacterium DAT-1]
MMPSTIKDQLRLGFGVLLALIVLVSFSGYRAAQKEADGITDLVDRILEVHASTNDVLIDIGNLRRFEKDSFINVSQADKVQSYKEKWEKTYTKAQDDIASIAKADPAYADRVNRLKTLFEAYGQGYRSVAGGLGTSLTDPASANAEMSKHKDAIHKMDEQLEEISLASEAGAKKGHDEIVEVMKQTKILIITLSSAACVLGIVIATFIGRAISIPLDDARLTAERISRDNDLSVSLRSNGSNEIARTMSEFSRLFDKLRQFIGSSAQNANEVTQAAHRLQEVARKVRNDAAVQSDASSAAAASIEEMTTAISIISDSAEQAHNDADVTAEKAQEGHALATQVANNIGQLSSSLESNIQVIRGLADRSGEIGGIVQAIKEIADQTNLLALNAAIEAARAGEQGRGFAVVADEVRKLAERTTLATGDISVKIGAVQSETHQAFEHMQQTGTQISHCVASAHQLAHAMSEIQAIASTANDRLNHIASAVHEQSAAAMEIAGHVERVAQMARENSEHGAYTEQSASNMLGLVRDLDGQIRLFRV